MNQTAQSNRLLGRHPTTVSSLIKIENAFQAIQSIFRPLEMHSEPRYKICFCSVIIGELESFRNYQGFSYFFSLKFQMLFSALRKRNLFYSSLHHMFESENFSFPFSYEKQPNLGGKMCKIKLQKSVGNSQITFQEVNMTGTVIQKFLAFLK